MPDFRVREQFPINAVVNATRQKQQQAQQAQALELQAKAQRRQELLQIFAQATQLTSALVKGSERRQTNSAREKLAEMVAGSQEQVPTDVMKPAGSTLFPGLTEAPTTAPRASTPGFQAGLQAQALRADPKAATGQLVKQAFPTPLSQKDLISIRDSNRKFDLSVKKGDATANYRKTIIELRRDALAFAKDREISAKLRQETDRLQQLYKDDPTLFEEPTFVKQLVSDALFRWSGGHIDLSGKKFGKRLAERRKQGAGFGDAGATSVGDTVVVITSDGQELRLPRKNLEAAKKENPGLRVK